MAANPPYRGVNWTSGVEIATRLVSLFVALALCGAPPPKELEARLLGFVNAHAKWLMRYPSLFSSSNNHRVSELAGLFLAGLCAPDLPDASTWRDVGRKGLEEQAQRQFHTDGVGVEQSPTYAAYSLEWFILAGTSAEAAGRPFSGAYRSRLALATEHLAWFLDEAGVPPRIGDDDEGRVLQIGQEQEPRYVASVVAAAQRWLGLPEIVSGRRDPALRDVLTPAPVQAPEPMPAPTGFSTFPEGGYSIWRQPTARGLLLLAMDHGPLGFLAIAAHGHADALSVWLRWGTEPILTDAGTYLYHAGGDERDRFRGTSAHNTLMVERTDQSRISGPFNWSRHAQSRLLRSGSTEVVAQHDGYLRRYGLIHRRALVFEPARILIIDSLLGQARRSKTAWSLGYTLDPAVAVEIEGARARVTTPQGRIVVMTSQGIDGEATSQWQDVEGLYSPAFNARRPARRLELSGTFRRGRSTRQVAVTAIEYDGF